MNGLRPTELIVLGLVLAAVTVVALVARRWRRPSTLSRLDEWGLGARQNGSWVSWFLIGSVLFTGYALVAAPAQAYTDGAAAFSVIVTLIVAFPLMMAPLARLWSVSRARGYLTTADFVRGRYGSGLLAVAVALTGIVAAVPLLALQFVAMESVTRVAGLNPSGAAGHVPLLVPYAILILITNRAGLRAPTLIAFVKVILVFLVAFVAILYLPIKLDGWAEIFNAAQARFDASPATTDGLLLPAGGQLYFASLALGSALALFLYPHAVTAVLACRNRDVVRRNMAGLPAFTMALAVLMLLGFAALAAGIGPLVSGTTGTPDTASVVPLLLAEHSPAWFAGLAFAAITVAAIVPAAVLAIGGANLWARSIYRNYLRRGAPPEQEARQARGAVVVLLTAGLLVALDGRLALDLHAIGMVLILQTLPAVLIPLYGRWLHISGLIVGWFAGVGYAALLLAGGTGQQGGGRFTVTAYPLSELQVLGSRPFDGVEATVYVGLLALLFNLVVAAVVTVLVRMSGARNGRDETRPPDYAADAYDPSMRLVGA